ncbi:MAG: tRNA (adenosine(37)-N6)-threonylcarbamoyltransferase complex dimerization subunit type 1 TsaB [Chitinivibrionales bacterium]|nr:tRNA (adenosine(37)-N6)-threonylcarbamoyltransferase complex dimerization subunit type 1 TsaB [Chitinivibrionales bacterium]
MSWTLGLDCSSVEMGLGLYGDSGPVCGLSRYVANSHAEHIASSVEMVLDSAGAAPGDIDRVGVATGPGSFTGLRIALAFVKGFCFDRDVKVLPVSSLHSLAHAWGPRTGPVVAAFDARRNEVFWARFEWRDGALVRCTDDALCGGDAFVSALGKDDMVVTDTLGYARSTVFGPLDGRAGVYGVERFPCQRGLSCAAIASSAPAGSSEWTSAQQVLPRYLRPSYAEERRAQREEKR